MGVWVVATWKIFSAVNIIFQFWSVSTERRSAAVDRLKN